jgi:hypothetical protein
MKVSAYSCLMVQRSDTSPVNELVHTLSNKDLQSRNGGPTRVRCKLHQGGDGRLVGHLKKNTVLANVGRLADKSTVDLLSALEHVAERLAHDRVDGSVGGDRADSDLGNGVKLGLVVYDADVIVGREGRDHALELAGSAAHNIDWGEAHVVEGEDGSTGSTAAADDHRTLVAGGAVNACVAHASDHALPVGVVANQTRRLVAVGDGHDGVDGTDDFSLLGDFVEQGR